MRDQKSILLVDMFGNIARVPKSEMNRFWHFRILRHAAGAVVQETGEVLKECKELQHYKPSPEVSYPNVRPIWGYLKRSRELYGDKAIRFKLGYEAENGFSVPPRSTLEQLYSVDRPEGS
jgi:hypothetical protein